MDKQTRFFGAGRTIVLAVGIYMTLGAAAQRNCGSMPYLEQQIAADPSRAERLAEIETFTERFVHEHGAADRAVVTIPVVFHVVYASTAQNISDAKIQAQIAQLNADFARLNSDAGSTPSAFASLGANTEIQFCLAQRDPNGNTTTGIVRKSTTVSSFIDNDNVKRSANGGSDPWPSSSYLNLWSCNLGNSLLGYAQFPGGAAATDGVVVLYSSVGSISSPGTATPYNLGRTATHEIGHWLNLRHIWGDATCGNDLVSDTPTQQTSNGGCPSFPHVTCSNGANGDMFMNYMDYTNDNCMNLFTLGQKSRMQALFGTGGSRASLATSLGCTPPSSTSCAVPSGLAAGSITTSSANLTWGAVSGATGYNVQFKLSSSSTWTTSSATSNAASLTGLTSSSAYNVQVQAVCSSGSSAYSTAISFTTTGTSCTDTWESNGTSGTAKTIGVNTNINATIGTSTDVDWFKFTNSSSASRMRIDLTNLAADYDVRLYRGTSTQVGISQNGGTTSEAIVYNTTSVATYYVKVYGYSGAYSASQCYTLRASTSGSNFREGDVLDAEIALEKVQGLLNLYPNPANDKVMLDYLANSAGNVQLFLFDGMGRQVLSTQQSVSEGPSTFGLPLPNLSNGVYVLHLVDGDQRYQQRILIQR